MAEGVDASGAPDEALRVEDLLGEIGMACVDTRVDDRDRNALERRKRDPRCIEPAVREIPLLRDERIRRRVRQVPRDERLDVAHTPDPAERDAVG